MDWYLAVLKKFVEFNGRARRKEYWMFFLVNAAISVVATVLGVFIGKVMMIILTLYMIAVILPSLGVAVRRLHDVGKTGWLLLVGLIPGIGAIWLFILMCIDGTPGENAYGPNPKQGYAAAT
jgi:uncharacterized membrane protein YhaH (DUF805 family)